jgi:response regulator RpfG family c-di-GMP phosphodiesterase
MISSNPVRPAEIMVLAGTKEDQSQLAFMLQSHGYQVKPVDTVETALSVLKSSQPDLLLIDASCSDMSMKLLYRKIKENSPSTDIPVIFITQMNDGEAGGHPSEEADFVLRPCREEDLLSKIQSRLKSRIRQKELDGLHNDLHMTQETLQTMLKSASDSVIFTDADWCITMINSMAGSMTGWPCDSAIGKQLQDVFRLKNEQPNNTAVFSMLESEMKNMSNPKTARYSLPRRA